VEGDGWRIVRREVPHFQPYLDSFGYRIEAGGKVFAYTSDLNLALRGGAPAALRELVQDADILVHYLNAFAFEARKASGFAGPRFAGELARDARVKMLVTTHHGPWIDSDGTRERMIADVGAIYSGRIVWGEDLMSFEL
jgi:ribonuclease BN (tRNA processing enzyme)